jgi:hypothetical protein
MSRVQERGAVTMRDDSEAARRVDVVDVEGGVGGLELLFLSGRSAIVVCIGAR